MPEPHTTSQTPRQGAAAGNTDEHGHGIGERAQYAATLYSAFTTALANQSPVSSRREEIPHFSCISPSPLRSERALFRPALAYPLSRPSIQEHPQSDTEKGGHDSE